MGWIKTPREKSVLFVFVLSELLSFYKVALPQGQGHEEVRPSRILLLHFFYGFFSSLIIAGYQCSVVKK